MSPTIAFLASFASILIGAATGMVLKRSLPPDMLEGGSKEFIRLAAGLYRVERGFETSRRRCRFPAASRQCGSRGRACA